MDRLSRNARLCPKNKTFFVDLSWRDVETEEKICDFKTVSRENQVCNHIFLLHHSVAGKRHELQ